MLSDIYSGSVVTDFVSRSTFDKNIMDYTFKGTPGPWRWELNEKHKDISLSGGVPAFDLMVMSFVRYGMNDAAPTFSRRFESDSNEMVRADQFAKEVKGREHHSIWFKTINHPDANLIAAAPDLLQALIDVMPDLGNIWSGDYEPYKNAISAINKALNIP